MSIFGLLGMRSKGGGESIPKGTLRAPYWLLEKRENHNNLGYHIHILKLQSGKYVRTNGALTVKDGKILLFFHNDGAKVSISDRDITQGLKVELKSQLKDNILRIPPGQWRPISKDKCIFLFNA